MKGRRISLDGVYDHSKEILLGPRSAPGLETQKAQGMATNPTGFFVITPLYLNNGYYDHDDSLTVHSHNHRTRVFVNRGWKPQNCQEWSRPQGTQRTVGIVQDWEQVLHASLSSSIILIEFGK
jgi:cytochrome oxidase assembly protein ShyY1